MKTSQTLLITLLLFLSGSMFGQNGSVGINNSNSNPDPSAMLDVSSATKGVLVPRMTAAQRDAISTPAAGLLIFCTDNNQYYFNTGTPSAKNWVIMNSQWLSNGTNLYYNSGNVGIGTTSPAKKLDISGEMQATGTGNNYFAGKVGVGTSSPAASAAVEISSTSQGLLPPRMTIAQRDAIASPAAGLIIFCTDCSLSGELQVCNGAAWTNVFGTASGCGVYTINHKTTGSVAPVNKIVTYGTVTNIPGEPSKCWTTSNLGADRQASAVNDATEASAGWYWQFNRKQGFKHDGTNRTPSSWDATNDNSSATWEASKDPCTNELGAGWRIPTKTEWENVDGTNGGNWTIPDHPWGSGLKLHAAGFLYYVDGSLNQRGNVGTYWSGTQASASNGYYLDFYAGSCGLNNNPKSYGFSVRCINGIIACGYSITKSHVAGNVAPVTKTVTYGIVTDVPGEPNKCWITSNLGADHQATAVDDATEASTGWYWQFNRKQGYKHDGSNRTPNTAWITSINETSDWLAANDPCTIELGTGWRIPTKTEWENVDGSSGGTWSNWNHPWGSLLKLHAAGRLLDSGGSLTSRGSQGLYWGSTQYDATSGWFLAFGSDVSVMLRSYKAYGHTARCLRD